MLLKQDLNFVYAFSLEYFPTSVFCGVISRAQ